MATRKNVEDCIDITRTSVDISKPLLKEVKLYCVEHEISIKEFIVIAIEEKLNK